MPRTLSGSSLEDRARKIVETLGGSWRRARGMCSCPAHADRTPSLSVSLGKRAVLFHCFAGCSNEAVIEALASNGIAVSYLFHGRGTIEPPPPRETGPDRNALRLWREAQVLTGSPAALYLANRGLAARCSDLRFHPQMPLGPKDCVRFLPAMIAAVRNDVGILALHRTFLAADEPRLAAFERPRRALGSLGNAAVRLAWPRGGRLGLAEGIETALSATMLFGIPCWATLGNERFGLVTIPDSVRELHLFVDHDAGGQLAEDRARETYEREGRRIVTRRPGRFGQDWNDVLKERQRAPA